MSDFKIDQDSLLNEKQAAAILNYSTRALQKWRHKGSGPKFIRVSTRSIRYRRKDLIAWMDERTRQSTSDTAM